MKHSLSGAENRLESACPSHFCEFLPDFTNTSKQFSNFHRPARGRTHFAQKTWHKSLKRPIHVAFGACTNNVLCSKATATHSCNVSERKNEKMAPYGKGLRTHSFAKRVENTLNFHGCSRWSQVGLNVR